MKKIFIFLLFFLLTEISFAEQFWDYMSREWKIVESWHEVNDSAYFLGEDRTLYMDEVEINNVFFVDARLKLETNGKYSVSYYRAALSDSESEMLRKIKSRNCGLVDTLGRLAARNASVKAKTILTSIKNGARPSDFQINYEDVTYCLVSKPISFTEPGFIYRYLFIKDGNIQLITDNRGDIYAGQLFTMTEFTDIKFGLIENDVFVEKTIEDINFEQDYVLQLMKEGIDNYFYF